VVVEEDAVGVVVVSDETVAKVLEDVEAAEEAFTQVVEEEVDDRHRRVIAARKAMEESRKLPHLRRRSHRSHLARISHRLKRAWVAGFSHQLAKNREEPTRLHSRPSCGRRYRKTDQTSL
jgi:hypothetical protein